MTDILIFDKWAILSDLDMGIGHFAIGDFGLQLLNLVDYYSYLVYWLMMRDSSAKGTYVFWNR